MKSRTESEIKQRVQRRIIACSVLLMGGKFLAFALTNSVGILTDAMESIVNVIGRSSVCTACTGPPNRKTKTTRSDTGKSN